jgi:hypothetical protein
LPTQLEVLPKLGVDLHRRFDGTDNGIPSASELETGNIADTFVDETKSPIQNAFGIGRYSITHDVTYYTIA